MLSKIFVFKIIVLILSLKLNLVSGLDKRFCTCQTNFATNIVGGIEHASSAYPWVASVTDSGYHRGNQLMQRVEPSFMIKDHKCTAFILNESWVITTKKCTANQAATYSVGFGYDKLLMFGNKIRVRQVIPHYDPNIDMSLLELEEPLTFSKYLRPACLDTKQYAEIKQPKDNLKLIATGFGKTSPFSKHKVSNRISFYSANTDSRYLKEVEMDDVSYLSYNPFMLSTYDAQEGQTVCLGDEGGPLHYTYQGKTYAVGLLSTYRIISGVNSRGSEESFCLGLSNAQYYRIAPQIQWIKSVLGENNYCDDEGPSMLLFGRRMAPNKKYDEAGPSNAGR